MWMRAMTLTAKLRSKSSTGMCCQSLRYGVMMAAQRAGDQRLADSAAAMVRKTSGNPQLTDSGMAKMHAEGGAGLPPGHPSAGMPQGHPPIGGAPSAPKTPAPKKTT